MLNVLRPQPLEQAISVDKYPDLVNKPLQEIVLFDLAVNLDSFKANRIIIDKANRSYNKGVVLTIIAIIVSIVILLANIFFKPIMDDKVVKVEIVNSVIMENNNNQTSGNNSNSSSNQDNSNSNDTTKRIVIPPTTPADREKLNEGVDPKKNKK